MVERNSCVHQLDACLMRSEVIVAVAGVHPHRLIEQTYLLPAISANQKRREVGTLHRLVPCVGMVGRLIDTDPGDEGQIVGEEFG